jgi:hypothetical protein
LLEVFYKPGIASLILQPVWTCIDCLNCLESNFRINCSNRSFSNISSILRFGSEQQFCFHVAKMFAYYLSGS